MSAEGRWMKYTQFPSGKAIRMVTHCDVSGQDIETTILELPKYPN
jgi:hypothetical protein